MIQITKPFFDKREEQAVRAVLQSGWVVQGPKVREFEEIVAEYTGSRYARATTSCTTALHLSLIALGISRDDEVIVPAFTFIATANVVEYVGAKPVFVDIDLKTFNIDISQVESAISPRTRAIIPVHLFGLCADMDGIREIARQHDLKVIEDAACAIGSFYHGKHSGTIGDAGCLSFHPRKSITTGEGGMVLTNDERVAREVERLRDHGASVSDLTRHEKGVPFPPEYPVVGYNFRMTDIQGAIGVEQMKKLPWILERKRRLAQRYDEALKRIPWLRTPYVPEGYDHGYQAYVCLFCPEEPTLKNVERLSLKRNELMRYLAEKGISTRQGTHAVIIQSYYAQKYALSPKQFPNAFIADRLSLALPLYAQMTEAEQEIVITELERAFQN